MSSTTTINQNSSRFRLNMVWRRRLLRTFALVVMITYTVLTLFPFYA